MSNVHYVSSNAKSSLFGAMLYIFDDNETVIKMIIKGRSPTMRQVSRTHRIEAAFSQTSALELCLDFASSLAREVPVLIARGTDSVFSCLMSDIIMNSLRRISGRTECRTLITKKVFL